MQFSLHTQHVELTPIEQHSLEKKLNTLEKYLSPPYTVDVVFQHDTHHLKGDVVTCRINIHHGRKTFHAERVGATIADTLDEVAQALQQELKKHHGKARAQRREDKEPPPDEELAE